MPTKKERAHIVATILDELYQDTPIPLDHCDPFTLLIAVLLSAQSTDKRVNTVTPTLFSKGPTPFKMVKVSQKTVENIIRPVGLAPRKSQNIIDLSQILLDKFAGAVPQSFEELEKLPGVGHKTASVVMSQAFGIPAFPVDTHIHRLAQRWGLTGGKNVVETEKDLKKLFPEDSWNKLHLQIIFYGRGFCTARGCDGTKCRICQSCYPHRKKAFNHSRA